jgi:mannose/fructose/N-acetylgalactosamine-specific phosphotransferase system component IID
LRRSKKGWCLKIKQGIIRDYKLCNATITFQVVTMIDTVMINVLAAALMAAVFFLLPRKYTPAVRILSAFAVSFVVLTIIQSAGAAS